jgi:hypothetical protein
MPCSTEPYLPAEVDSKVATCPVAPDPASLQGRVLVCHVPYVSRPYLPPQEGSGVVTCVVALDPASLQGRIPVLPRAPWLWTSHPD